MAIVADHSSGTYFAKVPTTVIFSDHLEDLDVSVWAYADSCKRDYTGFDSSGIKWPVIKVDDLAADLGVSKATMNRSISRLREGGFLTTEQTQAGNRFILLARSSKEDTFRGREINEELFSVVNQDLLLYGPSARPLRTWMIFDRIKGANEYAFASHAGIAKIMGSSMRTVRRDVAELKEFGLLTSERRTPGGMCRYGLSVKLAKHREVKPKKVVVKVSKPVTKVAPKSQAKEVVEFTGTWLKDVIGDDWIAWGRENYELVRIALNGIHDVVKGDGPEFMRDIMSSATKYYGAGYDPVESLPDTTYGYYDMVGTEYEKDPETQGHEEPVTEETIKDLDDAEPEFAWDIYKVSGPEGVAGLLTEPDTGELTYLAPTVGMVTYRERRRMVA